MATVTTPRRPQNLVESHRLVRHPLEKLRGYIRAYVGLEGLAVFLIYLALWFWVGLLLDFGSFKVFAVDWVQELPWAFRAGAFGLLLLGLVVVVAAKVFLRLFTEFRDDALALVMERRYPNELGDRLITAVELADVSAAAKYGYSAAMIEETIHDAAERVGKLPVQEVFNWKRLFNLGLLVVVLVVVGYLAAGGLAVAYDAVTDLIDGKSVDAAAGVGKFTAGFPEVASIWFERNILLRNTIWPRQAFLELLDFPESGDLRLGRDAPPPGLRVRALKWVLADSTTPEGWRALRWNDLTPALLGGEVPSPDVLPTAWQPRDPQNGLTLDEIDLQLDKDQVAGNLPFESLNDLRDVLAKLDARAGLSEMKRTMRKLKVPATVFVNYRGATTSGTLPLQRQEGNEYTGQFSELKESIRFTVRGEDYYTGTKYITVVPPPSVVKLVRDEYRPAYLYYRAPAEGSLKDLAGLKQTFATLDFSNSGADKSTFDLPAGSDVVVTASTDKDLSTDPEKAPRVVPRKGAAPVAGEVKRLDARRFQVRFENVRTILDFFFEFTDTDGVSGSRQVVIKPVHDVTPEIEVALEVIRKTNLGYVASVEAILPFSGKIRDDSGLESVEFVYTVARIEAGGGAEGARAVQIVSNLFLLPGGLGHDLLAATRLVPVAKTSAAADKEDRSPKRLPVASFTSSLQKWYAARLPQNSAERAKWLGENADRKKLPPFLREFELINRGDEPRVEEADSFFDTRRLNLRNADVRDVQQRYKLQLRFEATDNDAETGPHRGSSKETYTFLLVSDNELLTEIAKDEDVQYLKLAGLVTNLLDAKNKLEKVVVDLRAKDFTPQQYRPMAVRSEEIEQTREKNFHSTAEIVKDYRRIIKELDFNRINVNAPDYYRKVRNQIFDPLQAVVEEGGAFQQAKTALDAFRRSFDSAEPDTAKHKQALDAGDLAKKQMELLLFSLSDILAHMEGLTTINKLIEQLKKIEEEQRKQYEVFNALHKSEQEKLLKELLKPKEKDKQP